MVARVALGANTARHASTPAHADDFPKILGGRDLPRNAWWRCCESVLGSSRHRRSRGDRGRCHSGRHTLRLGRTRLVVIWGENTTARMDARGASCAIDGVGRAGGLARTVRISATGLSCGRGEECGEGEAPHAAPRGDGGHMCAAGGGRQPSRRGPLSPDRRGLSTEFLNFIMHRKLPQYSGSRSHLM